MSSKSWRLVVTELGASAPTSEAHVEAGNWMTALTLARAAIGESGGVPPGASCSVAPDGRVTIQDAVARKTYSLVPDVTTSLSEPPPPKGPRVPSDPAPRRSAAPAKLRVPKPSQPPPARPSGSRATIAYDAAELGLANAANPKSEPPKSDAPPAPKRRSQQTVAYDAAELGLANAAPPKSEPPKSDAPPAPKRRSQQTVAYDAAELGLASAAKPKSEPPKSDAPPAPKRRSQQTVAYDAAELGIANAGPPKSEPPKSDAPAAPKRRSQQTIAYDAAELGLASAAPAPAAPSWDLLHSRDEEPSEDSPLLYRERTYVVLQQTSEALAEAFLRERFRELQRELAARPKGKLVNMALFDHRWEERPAKPPLVTLQWKDWRGEPVIVSPARPGAAASTPSTPPPGGEPATSTPSTPPPGGEPAASTPMNALADAPTAPATTIPIAASTVEARTTDSGRAPSTDAQPAPADARAPASPAPEPHRPEAPDALDLDIVEPAPARGAQGDRLATAFEALQDLFFLTTPVEGLDFVVRLLEDLVPCEAVSACLYDINTDEFRFVVLTGPGAEERRGEAVPRSVGLFGAAAMTGGEALLVEVTGRDERYDPGIDGRVGIDPETMALAAVAHGGRLLGLLQLINRQGQAQFSRADANLLTYVAEKLGEFLHAARTRAD